MVKKITCKQVELTLRRFGKQLKEKDGNITVNEATTLSRLASATARLYLATGSKTYAEGVKGAKGDFETWGDPDFYSELKGE